jgi:predicted nuclease with TOPRIM domain
MLATGAASYDTGMSNYLANYRKKLQIRKRREDDLRRLLARGASELKLLAAATDVQSARVRALRAQQAKIAPADFPKLRQRFAELEEKIALISAKSAQDVLAEFRPY